MGTRARAATRSPRPSPARRRTPHGRGATASLRVVPVTPERWPDLEQLFDGKGACAGCWCMWMRLPLAQFNRGKGEGNRRALRALTARRPPGLLAYQGDAPVGWVAVAPRDEYLRLANSRVLEPVAGERVWAAPCFFVKASHRGRGVTLALLESAAVFARRHGARSIEGYPTTNRSERQAPAFVHTGFESTFRRAGFVEVARRSPTRPILRRDLVGRPRAGTPVNRGPSAGARG